MFQKVLVANRGEIAVRVIRACRDLGIQTVAVYSDVDRGSLHVRLADQACHIGSAPSLESYLRVEGILDAARQTGAQAIHPGYGFLSENADFARAVRKAGMAFIGPSADSIELMGSKLAARRTVSATGVPVVPGSLEAISSDSEAARIASEIGYPLMLKASAGGGGKGMRVVVGPADLTARLREARSEARAAFGDDAVYIERFVAQPRHIEVQLVADQFGEVVHLGERECTIQRRHQKVIEESPSPFVDEDLRAALADAAIRIARATAYDSIGTVEFLVDGETGQFYFLEMNTRVQVEHAVTEAVTGFDLIAEQLRIASGKPCGIRQEDVRMRGAAIECRIYAEDPERGFVPSPGRILRLEVPSGPGIREDTGIYAGWEVPLEYDPLLSKVIAWGSDRDQAIRRMVRALTEYRIEGVQTNIDFFLSVLRDPSFLAGCIDTGFVGRWLEEKIANPAGKDDGQGSDHGGSQHLAAILAAVYLEQSQGRGAAGGARQSRGSAWKVDARSAQLRAR